MASGGDGRGTLGAQEHPLEPSRQGQVGQQVGVVDGHRGAAGLPEGGQHQEVAQRLGHVDPERHGRGVLDQDRLVGAGLERGHDRRAPGGLHADQPRQVALDPAQLARLGERLVDADQADPATGRVDDDVGHPPAELLGDLQPHRLLALDPVGLLQRGDLEPVLLGRPHRRPDQPARVGDQPVDEAQVAPGHHGLRAGDPGRVHGHRDGGVQAGPGGVRRPGRAGVAVGRHGEPGRAQLPGPRDPDRGAARLEGAGGQQAVVLDQQPGEPELRAEPRDGQQRRHALAQGHDVLGRRHGQQLVVAPQVRRPAGDLAGTGPDAAQVVPRQQR